MQQTLPYQPRSTTLLRNLILLAYFREQSRESLAKTHGIPTGTIKTNLRRSLLELRQSIQLAEAGRRASAAA